MNPADPALHVEASHAVSRPAPSDIHASNLPSPVAASPAWTFDAVAAIYHQPFMDLLFQAQNVTRAHFDANTIQLSTLVSIKTGGCPEDCGYCPQAARYHTGVSADALMPIEDVVAAARAAKARGATRFCMGAAWRSPKPRHLEAVAQRVAAVKALGLGTCATLGMLADGQAEQLKAAGLDYYNHNLDTSPAFYGKVITTRVYDDRLQTLQRVRDAGINVCCGGIVGMGESAQDRIGLLCQLANLQPYPQSVPINDLVKVAGTPLADTPDLDPLEFVRTVATARTIMPQARVRLSAGRQAMSASTQALCFLAGANSIFYGETLLTTANPAWDADRHLFDQLGLTAETRSDFHYASA